MLEMKPSPGVMTIRASASADHAEIRRRALAALDDGRRVVVLATKPGVSGIMFAARHVGHELFVTTPKASARLATPAAAIGYGLRDAADAWARLD